MIKNLQNPERREMFWHGVRLGYAQGTMAGGVIGVLWFLFVDWRWSIVFAGVGCVGVCAWTWERISWERRGIEADRG